jgi:hypothetical protein
MGKTLPFLFLLTSALYGQYCDCFSYMAVSRADGSYYAYSRTNFIDPYGYCGDFEYCFESASVESDIYENGSLIWGDYETDNYGQGYAEAITFGNVNLNSKYEVDGYHSITGTYYDYEYTQWNLSIPPPPSSVQPQSVNANSPTLASISYTISPDVLYSVAMEVGGQVSFSNNTSAPNFTFNQASLPDGTSQFNLTGYMYGYYVAPYSGPTVTRTEMMENNTRILPVPIGNDPPESQYFTLDVYEFSSKFDYSLSSFGLTTLANGGLAAMSTDPGGATIEAISGTNTVQDGYGNYASDNMSPPSGPTYPEQGPTFRSLSDNFNIFFAPGASAQICVAMAYNSTLGDGYANFGCPGMTLP